MAVIYQTPQFDTYMYNQEPNKNFSDKPELLIGYAKPDNIYRSILKFNLDNIPQPAFIDKGIMRLYLCTNDLNFTKCIDVHLILTPYDGRQVTFNNQPEYNISYVSSTVLHSEKSKFIEWNITELVKGWFSGGISNNGILLKSRSEKMPSLVSFAASDNSYKPFQPLLLVDYCNNDLINRNVFYTATTTPAYTNSFNTFGYKMATFFVINKGKNVVTASVEVSPDCVHWFEEGTEQITPIGGITALVPRIFARYTRLKYFTSTGSSKIQVYMQGQG